jgi:hypothetical protein
MVKMRIAVVTGVTADNGGIIWYDTLQTARRGLGALLRLTEMG